MLNPKPIWILPILDVASIEKEKQRKGEREREREERRREKTQCAGLIKRTCGIKTIVCDNLNSSSVRLFSFFSL